MKKPRRKPPKKVHPKQPKIDDDLAELASVLDEYRLERNSDGWFNVPWRDGWNAVGLAMSLSDCQDKEDAGAQLFLKVTWENRRSDASVYWEAGDFLQTLGRDINVLTCAALRCLQVSVSNSSGGGEVYNAILTRALTELPVHLVEAHVLEWRCRDAIGTTAYLQGDLFDRRRRAFKIAWERGLFLAAYAIMPTKIGEMHP